MAFVAVGGTKGADIQLLHDEDTGEAAIGVRRSRGIVDYEERHPISAEELRHFLANPAAVAAYARELDSRSVALQNSQRGESGRENSPLGSISAEFGPEAHAGIVPERSAAASSPAVRVPRRLDWFGLIFAFVPLAAGSGMVYSAAGSVIGTSTDAAAAASWPSATGRVTRTWIDTGSTVGNRGLAHEIFAPRVAYEYQVGGSRYQSDRLSLSQPHQEMARDDAEAVLAAYSVGSPVEVHYDRTDPARATLIVEGPNSISYFLLGLGFLLGAFGLYCFWRVLSRGALPGKRGRAHEAELPG